MLFRCHPRSVNHCAKPASDYYISDHLYSEPVYDVIYENVQKGLLLLLQVVATCSRCDTSSPAETCFGGPGPGKRYRSW